MPMTFSMSQNRRQNSRDSLFLMADLRLEGSSVSKVVRVRNLSPGGLMAEYPHPIEMGRAVEIDLRGIGPVVGQVAWTAAGRIGVAFNSPIDPLQARKPVVSDKTPAKDKPIKSIF